MTSQKTIELYVHIDGENDIPFYGMSYEEFILSNGETFVTKDGFVFNVRHSNEQIKVGSFRYDAKRMGGAPTITFTLMYEECLDKLWSDQIYAKFRGERYFLKQTPTSSKSNDDARYKHDVELVAERVILDDTYFYDAIVGSPLENDKPVTNSTKFNFYGNIEDFVTRMNASLQYTGIQKVDEGGNIISGYHVVLDDDIVKRDEKQVSFDGAVFSQALQEAYNTFGIPFYFDGQTIHVGFSNNVINDVLEYGVDGALISATKQNANFKVINRATGDGSSDNLPYFYPNNSPKGEITAEVATSSSDFEVIIKDYELYADKVKLDGEIKKVSVSYEDLRYDSGVNANWEGKVYEVCRGAFDIRFNALDLGNMFLSLSTSVLNYVYASGEPVNDSHFDIRVSFSLMRYGNYGYVKTGFDYYGDGNIESIAIPIDSVGQYRISGTVTIKPSSMAYNGWLTYRMDANLSPSDGWQYEGKIVDLEDLGLETRGVAHNGDTITQRLLNYTKTSNTLLPPIYRDTRGAERFYNAVNYPFAYEEGYELKYGEYVLDGEVHNDVYKKDDGSYYEFTNEYKEGRPREHVFTVDDIKPTIKEMTNDISWEETDEEGETKTVFQRIDMFSEFAYNIGDNDETYIDPNGDISFKHPYFFAKLRKLDFNLFEHASEAGAMTISMTSGHCGACNFEIGVDEDEQFNPVQVYEEDTWEDGVFHARGSLKYDENGYVLCGLEDFQGEVQAQDRQQDTINNEVWIALKKEESTYGILMPKAPKYYGTELTEAGHRPKACSSENANDGDTFVIINITLPNEYIYKAEKKLEKSIIKYIWENNVEKFNFSVNFSRIFLEENPNVLNTLNENARLTRVKYNGDEYILYVSSYSYSMNEGDALPEIRVELDDTLTIAQNALQNAIDSVKSDVASAINAIDIAAIGSRYFLRKDTYDAAEAPIEFKKGVVFGDSGMVEVNEDGTSKLTIDYLDVTRKATFTSLEIQEKTHVGGQFLITPASMTCANVEELEDVYRCYFQADGDRGEEIFNTFAVNDQAICQTYNTWGVKFYWRLVTEVGRDYIDLSKTDCASESDIPSVGDKIIQLGNRNDKARQAAQVLSSYGENAPSFIMYNGIDSFSLEGKEITGILWNPTTQQPQMYSFGDFFFGDRSLESNFITFQKREGDEEKSLHINANVTIGANSSGLTNLSEWKEAEDKINEASQGVTLIQQDVQNIQDQIDGVVENHFYVGVPTADNFPAIQWTTDTEKANHVGDTYINIATEEQDPDNAGKAWRWAFTDNEHTGYHWHPIADTDAVKALLEAYKAQAGIDDLQYLKGTFAKSVDVDGVVMSEMMAVKNEEGDIEAFLNGSDFAKDSEVDPHTSAPCGKLILAAGIPETTEYGSLDLEERAKEATTRIYEDGCTYTKNLNIQEGCTIGELQIGDGEIYCGNTRFGGQYNNNDGLLYNPNEEKSTRLNKYGITTVGHTNRGKASAVSIENGCAGHSMLITIGKAWTFCGDRGKDVGLEIDAPNEFAICIDAGQIAGLRPKTRCITQHDTLSNLDYHVLVDTRSETWIKLPSNPELGQTHELHCVIPQNTSNFLVYLYTEDGTVIHEPQSDKWNEPSIGWYAFGVIKVVFHEDRDGGRCWWAYRLA